MIENY